MKEKITAIVLAAGQGKRMHSKIQKQFLEIQDSSCIVLFSEMLSGQSADRRYYSCDRKGYDFLL